jgi:hypothetical protein
MLALTACGQVMDFDVGALGNAPGSVGLQELRLPQGGTLSGQLPSNGATGATFQIVQTTQHGALAFGDTTGAFTYVPDAGFSGMDSFVYAVRSSSTFALSTGTVLLEVNAVPAAQDLALTVAEDETLQGHLPGTDAEGAALLYSVTEAPANGQLQVDEASGTFVYHPNPDFNGSDAFRFVVDDGQLDSPPATVAITVTPVDDAPVAQDGTLDLLEDTPAAGQLAAATDIDSPASGLTYAIVQAPAHGTVTLIAETGAYTYQPAQDYAGADAFRFVVNDGEVDSAPATVTLAIAPVNDPPALSIPDQTNSTETLETFVAVPERDVDGDPLQYTVVVADPNIATAQVDGTDTLILTPLTQGSTSVTVTASDGVYQAAASFQFTVGEVEKLRVWQLATPHQHAISIRNVSQAAVPFVLRHNGARLFTNGPQILDELTASPDAFPGEPLQRKLWRGVRDGTYHWTPLTEAYWQHSPLLLLNSIGFGFCDDVASALTTLARDAGFEARTWALNGHVVPEILADGRWELWDPDLAVYYFDRQGLVAGVEELAADTSLITAPEEPRALTTWAWPYDPAVADIYGTTANNSIVGAGYEAFYVEPRATAPLALPAGAAVTYPGKWSAQPTSTDGTAPPVVTQLKMDLPAGFTGTVDWPLVLWDVQGSGRVRFGGVEYAAGSPEVTAALQALLPPPEGVEVLEATGTVTLVYLVNPVRFGLRSTTELRLVSPQAWALQVDLVDLAPSEDVGYPDLNFVSRPTH